MRRIADLAVASKLPAMAQRTEFAEAGGVMTYGPSYSDLFRRSAFYVGKILGGAKPADLPIEQVTKFELIVNLKTAKALGLTMPKAVLPRADQCFTEDVRSVPALAACPLLIELSIT